MLYFIVRCGKIIKNKGKGGIEMEILKMKSKILDVHKESGKDRLQEELYSFASYHMSDGFSKNIPEAVNDAVIELDNKGKLAMQGNGFKIYGWCKKKENIGVVIYTDEPYETGEYSLLMMKYLYIEGVTVEGSVSLALEKVFWAMKEDPLFKDLEDISLVNGYIMMEWKSGIEYIEVDTTSVYTIIRDLLNKALQGKN